MNAETDQALTRAYELIEQERLDEAQAVLNPVLASEKDNADAWWLYAHAVTDVDSAREAIQNVLRVDPNYPEARELLASLENTSSPPRPVRTIERIGAQPSATVPAAPPTLPDMPAGSQFDLDDGMTETEPRRLLGTRQIAILLPILLIVIVGSLLILLNSSPPVVSTVTPTVEQQADVPTLPVTDITPPAEDTNAPTLEQTVVEPLEMATSIPINTDVPSTTAEPQPTDDIAPTEVLTSETDFDDLYEALSAFTIPRDGIVISQTEMGDTLMVTICTTAGPELRTALNDAMRLIANSSAAWAGQVDAVGARMVNCGSNTTLLLIGAAIEDAVAYADGELDEESFQAGWISQ